MKRHIRFVTGIAICFLAAGSAVAQQGSSPEKFKASGEHASFEWLFLPIGAGKEQGLWARNGLDPEFVPAAASAAQLKQQVEAGIKIGLVNTAEVLLARSQGTPVKVVAGYLGETIAKIFVRADSPMTTAKELDGKKVGILSQTHTSYRAVLYMNDKLGIKAEPVALGNLANNTAALKAGAVDAIYSAEGAALTLVDSGLLKILVPLPDVYPRPYTAVVVWATDDLIEQRPDTVKRFVKTILEAVRYLKENPDRAIDLYIAKTNAPRSLAARAVTELNKFLMPDGRGSGRDLVSAVGGNWQFTKDSGAIPAGTAVNVQQAVDARFLP
jgi:ABC-type nitrate/sulfonate/bicarbonate transport system substrate-binding protein